MAAAAARYMVARVCLAACGCSCAHSNLLLPEGFRGTGVWVPEGSASAPPRDPRFGHRLVREISFWVSLHVRFKI